MLVVWDFILSIGVFVSFLPAVVFGLFLHEGTHYTTALLWTSDHKITSGGRTPLPDTTEFTAPHELPNYAVRIIAISPAIWTITAVYIFVSTPVFGDLQNGVAFLMIAGAGIISPTDLLAFTHPSIWKEIEASSHEHTSYQALRLLFRLEDGFHE